MKLSHDLALRRVTESITARGVVNIHDPHYCLGQRCVFHRPSLHSMLLWPINIRSCAFDSVPGLVERLCPHGVGHPDPDSAAYFERSGTDASTHGCDGCCRQNAFVTNVKTLREYLSVFVDPWRLLNKLTRTEMAEGGLQRVPHCCSQDRCWAHLDRPWCRCRCSFCRIANRVRHKLPKTLTLPSLEDL